MKVHYSFRLSYILDIDECSSKPCHLNTTCENKVGSYMCVCEHEYSGDGFNITAQCVHLISYQENDTQYIYNYVVIE